ncbi:SCO-spondin-like [Portunus trituberculatus]|uniref:SCO-spondin-like n=1 Tax=Portunus trituberculatus TaxID=210409 RepID=UPI001E1D073C|nr:SCO-spondin-like [Portunus trituberculatus]
MRSTMARHVAVVLSWAVLLQECGVQAQQSCCYGKTRLAHGETALTLERCCVSFVCNNGDMQTVHYGKPETGNCHEKVCEFDGQVYPNGTKLAAHCSGLVCVNGQWKATGIIEDCCAHCFLFNAHHVDTFDDNHYMWGRSCNYSIVQTGLTHQPRVAVFSTFEPCFGINSQQYCLQQTTFRNDPHTLITLRNKPGDAIFDILVNGNGYTVPDNVVQEVRSSPGLTHNVLAWRELGCVFLLGSSGLTIKYCLHRMDVWAFPTLSSTPDSLHGLCGHFNFYPSDDMTARDGVVYPVNTFPLAFPESWRTLEQVHPQCSSPVLNIYSSLTSSDSCEASAVKKQEYHVRCSKFLHPVLGVDTELKFHVDACEHDLCLMDQGGVSEAEQQRWLIETVKITQHSKLLLAQIKGVFVPHPLFAPLEGFCVPGSSWTVQCNRCSCTEDRSVPVCTLIACSEDFVPEIGGEFCSNGSRWRSDECNVCVCINKGIVCSFDECSNITPSAQTASTFSTLSLSSLCKMRPEPGLCDPVLKWYYDLGSGRCSQFFSTHCGQSHNTFDYKEVCETMCGFLTTSTTVTPATPVPLLCYMKWDAGTCRGLTSSITTPQRLAPASHFITRAVVGMTTDLTPWKSVCMYVGGATPLRQMPPPPPPPPPLLPDPVLLKCLSARWTVG